MFHSYVTSASTTYGVKVWDEFHVVPLSVFNRARAAGKIPDEAVVDMSMWELPATRNWNEYRLVDKFVPVSDIGVGVSSAQFFRKDTVTHIADHS
eukprot:4287037-Amphidinium_carterae.4